ncbi:MAG: DUF192 domain-containing protein [Micrococcales bacterium]|nr:DUF192 domain-containing protein [Micrococcales bacterium]
MDTTARLHVDGADVAEVIVADTYLRRLRGMLWRNPLPPALVLTRTTSVHGIGMRHALDVAVLDAEGTVLKVAVLRPWGLTGAVKHGRQVLEAPVGSFRQWDLGPGTRVEVTAPS